MEVITWNSEENVIRDTEEWVTMFKMFITTGVGDLISWIPVVSMTILVLI